MFRAELLAGDTRTEVGQRGFVVFDCGADIRQRRSDLQVSLRAGKRTREWQAMREKLKVVFEAAGITRCEFNYDGCWHDNGLTFAHIRKRRNLHEGELEKVALACMPCHNKLELLPEGLMTRQVLVAIESRPCQPAVIGVT